MRIKLALIYLLILLALSTVGYISYNGLTNLMTTLRLAVQPDERETEFKDLLNLMHSGENNMRLYNITHIKDYLLAHDQITNEINFRLQKLSEECEGDSVLSAYMDSLQSFYDRKNYCHAQLIRLKRTTVDIPDVMEKVLTEVDSIENSINSNSDSVQTDSIPADSANAEKPKKKKGFLSWLFQPKKKEESAAIPDTTETVEKSPVNISAPIKKTFEEINRRDAVLKKQLMERDLEYTRENDALSIAISRVTEQASGYLQKLQAEKAKTANAFFIKTTRYIAITGTASALLLLILILIITRDVQVIMRTKRELEAAKSRAEQLARTKEEFLASMSHEIRTPLSAIIGFAKYLKQEKLTEDGKEYLSIISNSSDHLLQIINEILDFSKLDAGRMQIEAIPFNAYELMMESAEAFTQEANDKNIRLITRLDDSLKENNIISDPYRIRQVLTNLLSNAVKFTEQGYVELKAGISESQQLDIVVKDTGTGIPEESLQHIFDKFRQADNSTTRKYGGTGLGLSIVRKIVDLMHGNIAVDSVVDRGTTFNIGIPVKITSENIASEPEKETSISLEGINVMAVDDDPYNLMLIEKILGDRKATVISATSGEEALKLVQGKRIDVMINDIHMPGMNGYDLMKATNGTIPAIAVSAYVNESTLQKCKTSGFKKVFRKPVPEKELISLIRELVPEEDHAKKTENVREGIPSFPEPSSVQVEGTDPATNNKLMNIYYDSISDALSLIKNYPVERDYDKIRYQAHKLIPSTRHMGYSGLADTLKKIEEFKLMPQNINEAEELIREFTALAEKIREQLYIRIAG